MSNENLSIRKDGNVIITEAKKIVISLIIFIAIFKIAFFNEPIIVIIKGSLLFYLEKQ